MTGDPWGRDPLPPDPAEDGSVEDDPVEVDLTATGPGGISVGGSGAAEDDPVARVADASSRIRAAARRAIEALVLVTEEPISAHLLGQLLEMSPAIVDDLCRELAAEYEDQGRGFQLIEVAGGWRYQSHPDLAPYVERYVLEGQTAKLSAAALETLAIVAYKQPISRAQVASIRGVSVDGVMRTLQQRGYITEIGKDPGPGQAVLFGTTRMFEEKLGLNDVRELPPLGDFVPGADVVEQLERGLRPDREPLRPEDAMLPGDQLGADDGMNGMDDLGADDADDAGDGLDDRGVEGVGFGRDAGFDGDGFDGDTRADSPPDDPYRAEPGAGEG